MAYTRVRNLDPQFVKEVVPLLPPHKPGEKFDVQNVKDGMGAMKVAKDRALEGPWKHLRDSVSFKNVCVPMRDGHKAEMRIFKATTQDEKEKNNEKPVYYSLHGGGFITGSNDTEELINRQLTLEAGLIIFSLDYRLAPEHTVIPTIYNDAEDGLNWVVSHARGYGGTSSKLIVGGTSVGAQLAAMLAYRLSTDLKISGLLCRQPALIFGLGIDREDWKGLRTSYEENADSPLLNTTSINQMNEVLELPPQYLADPDYFPIFAQDLHTMPPTYLVGAGCDPMVDDVTLFDRLLREQGVKTQIKVYKGMPHGFHAFHNLKVARDEMVDTAEGLKWLLSL